MSALTLALPSKGRLMEQAEALFASAGLSIRRTGTDRGYRGIMDAAGIEVAFLSASEIAQSLKDGTVDFG
ncbi:MAG: ATP phosphoribosyltransferase, partial [Aestuariivirgaceae bacterium]|nr:ATP phosphoribosyltransferase [Aestuariivirgaceae bacterium]